jgi:signal transduction histidine kinase
VLIDDNGDELIETEENEEKVHDPFDYLQIKVTSYFIKGEENCLIQMIDETKNIMHEEAIGQNKTLQMINATVSHELRNPLNSIIFQSVGILYNHN